MRNYKTYYAKCIETIETFLYNILYILKTRTNRTRQEIKQLVSSDLHFPSIIKNTYIKTVNFKDQNNGEI